jgi:predicted ribosomally synthesized peptide with SipW-like signal peptide
VKKSAAKKALIASAAALSLSAMLFAGTTYAWFTDSASSAASVLQSGNLDIGLEIKTADGIWKDISEVEDIFSAINGETDDLWEPGHVETAYLRIKNNGSLALKYELNIATTANTFTSVTNKENQSLTDYVKYGIQVVRNNDIDICTSRQEALAALDEKDKDFSNTDPIYESLDLESQEYDTIMITAYMPEETGNDANWNGKDEQPEIFFKLYVNAGQAQSESDSYGSDYDAKAAQERAALFIDRGYIPKETWGITQADFAKGPVVLTGNVTQDGRAITSDYIVEMNNQTIAKTANFKLTNVDNDPAEDITVSLTNGTYEIKSAHYGAMTILPASGTAVNATFENVNFTSAQKDAEEDLYTAVSDVITLMEYDNSSAKMVFKNCVFDETFTRFGMYAQNTEGSLEVVFENCVFINHGTTAQQNKFTKSAVNIVSHEDNIYGHKEFNMTGSVTFKDCEFTLESQTEEKTVSAVTNSSSGVSIVLEGTNTINGNVITSADDLLVKY